MRLELEFKMFELSLILTAKRIVLKFTIPLSTLILNMRGLFEENPLMKNCGITLEREIRLEVDKEISYLSCV